MFSTYNLIEAFIDFGHIVGFFGNICYIQFFKNMDISEKTNNIINLL